MTQHEPTWWTAFHAGDLAAFAQLIETYQQDVRAIAYAVLLDDALAEDVAQDTFIAAWTRRAQLRDPASLGGWLVAIARNRGRDLLRARRREVLIDEPAEIAADASSPQLQLEREALRASCRTVLARVPERYREVLVLYYSQDRPVVTIAKTLGISEAAAMQRLSRGRRYVERYGGELAQLVGVRRDRSLAIAVLALLALRGSAEAATPRPRPRSASLLVGLGCALATFASDGAASPVAVHAPRADQPAPPSARETPRIAERGASLPLRSELAHVLFDASRAPAPLAVDSDARQTPFPGFVDSPHVDSPHVDSFADAPRAPLRDAPAAPLRARLAIVDPFDDAVPSEPARVATIDVAVEITPPSLLPLLLPKPPQLPLDQINALTETAGMPRPGDVSFEVVGAAMMLRAGITDHVALHIGEVPMDTDKGTTGANVATAFGAGIKLGGKVVDNLHLSVLAEAANEVNVKALKARDGWVARSYASLTWRRGRHHATLFGGVVAEFDGTNRWRSPIGGLATQLGWDDRLAFIIESQYLADPIKTKQTHVVGVRFRAHDIKRSILGIERARIDVGAIYLDRVDDEDDLVLPWLQAGLGW